MNEDVLGEVKEWTDSDEINKHMEYAATIQESYVKIASLISQMDPRIGELPAIVPRYNNKMVEIYQFYEEKEHSYTHSLVSAAVNDYLLGLIQEAIGELEKFVNKNAGNISLIRRDIFHQSVGVKHIERYKEICNQISSFSLEKDIEKAINYSIDREMKQDWYDGSVNDWVDGYNHELGELGVPTKISYREKTGKTKAPVVNEKKVQNVLSEHDQELEKMLEDHSAQRDSFHSQDTIQK